MTTRHGRQREVTEVPATMTRAEAMAALHISRSTYDRMVANGELTVYWAGNRRKQLVSRDSVLQYFRQPANAVVVRQRQGL